MPPYFDNAQQQVFIEKITREVKKIDRDSSHDWWHTDRVRKIALVLAELEGLPEESWFVVELAALLHDLDDHKYVTVDHLHESAKGVLASSGGASGVHPLTQAKDALGATPIQMSQELAVVQDADRLDAIGAIGVARCLTFGGAFGRQLHDPDIQPREYLTKEAYLAQPSTTINHFYEKLLRLKDMMNTKSGRRIAERRHAFMEVFLKQFLLEWEGKA